MDQLGRMWLRAGNTDRLKRVFLIKRIGDPAALRRRPCDGLVGEFDPLRDPRVGAAMPDGRMHRRGTVRGMPRTSAWRSGNSRLRSAVAAERTPSPSRAAWQRPAPRQAMTGMPSHRRRAAGRSPSAASRSSCRAWHRPRHRSRPRTRRDRVPANGRRRRSMPDCPGTKPAPVIATRRPPSGSRAKADAMCRKAASAMRRSTLATAENGGFISTTLGMMPVSR